MPIALFPELAAALTKVGGKLSSWERLVGLEEQILRRARGAFLVHWFGKRVPEKRLSLHIAIVNIAALRARYEQVRRSMPQPFPRLNLFGPLAGMAGFAAGLFMSPSGSFLFAPHLHQVFDTITDAWWGDPLTMFYALVGNWIMPLLGPGLVVGLAAPVAIIGALAFALSGDRTSHAVIRLLGDVAMMTDAFLTLWDQLRGPVGDIQNPLLRAIMEILGRVSVLFAHTLGFVGILLVKLVPLIPNLIAQFRAAADLGRALIATLMDIVSGFLDTLMAPFTGQRGLIAVLRNVFVRIMALPGLLMEQVEALVEGAQALVSDTFDTVNSLLSSFVSGVIDRITQAFHMTPLGYLLHRVIQVAALIPPFIAAINAIPEPRGESDDDSGGGVLEDIFDFMTGGVIDQLRRLERSVGALELPSGPDLSYVPDLPALPGLPDTSALGVPAQAPALPDFGDKARRLLNAATEATGRAGLPAELLRRPRSAFADQVAELEEEGAPVLSEEERRLRDMIYLAIGRALPAALRIHTPLVRSVFDTIDAVLYPDAESDPLPPADHPQLTLPDSGRLSPVVERLTIRSVGGLAPDVRVFRDGLVRRMRQQTYRVPAAG